MPKVTFGANRKTDAMRHMEKDIISNYGMHLSITNVGKVLGKKDRKSAWKWIKDQGLDNKTKFVEINGHKAWYAADIARVLAAGK